MHVDAALQSQIRNIEAPSLDFAGTQEGKEYSVRWIMNLMSAEYARHNGHAGLLRQRIDGAVGC